MIQTDFAQHAADVWKDDPQVIGLAAGGSHIAMELDDYSDIDLVLVTKDKIGGDAAAMQSFAQRLGNLLTAFTGEHVGEPRLLICLYDAPLLHVDIKFVTLEEFRYRVEDPVILLDKEGQLQKTIAGTTSVWPRPSFQWYEDRFWTFIHYGLLKVGRGEYFEALDFLSALRMMVLGPLLQVKNGQLPRGVRKLETRLSSAELSALKSTLAAHDRDSLLQAIDNAVGLYRRLREELFTEDVQRHPLAEQRVMEYMEGIKNG